MKLRPTAAAVPLLLMLLTWLLLRGMNPEAEGFNSALQALDDFKLAESALHRDVLSARAGLLRNYDPLVREVTALEDALDHLREASSPDTRAAIGRLAALENQQEELTERFKSSNALLQNSLTSFGLLSARLGASDQDTPIDPPVSALAAAMLHFTLDTSPEAAREVAKRLEGLARQPYLPSDAEALDALLAHGRLLHSLLPATDGALQALLALPTGQEREAVRRMILSRQTAALARAQDFRLLLYAASLVLVGLLVQLGLKLRQRSRAREYRAAFEHAIAGISTGFIDARSKQIPALVERALGELAAHLGAERAYFILAGPPARLHLWHAEGVAFPPGWPERALQLAARWLPTAEGVIHVPRVDHLLRPADREDLAAVGLHGWACAPSMVGGRVSAILGFDALRPGLITGPLDELGLLRMALDVFANAVGREVLERERDRLEARLQQARRMETVGALTSGIAHNFNNMVGAILGHAEMAEAQIAASSRAARNLEAIRRAAERARDLIDQILDFGRRRDARRRPVNLRALIAESAALLQASWSPSIELVVGEIPAAAVVSGEPGQLQQVVLNLCNNAAQAMSGAGRVEIETALEEVPRRRSLSHGELARGRYVRIAVTDSGHGMDAAVLERIFEPFFTTRLAGNGLGLATVREIVREHGGAMEVRSTPGIGSRFEVWLPRIAAAEPQRADGRATLPFGRGQTLLVIDDDRERLLHDEEMLAALGYEPVGYLRGADALTACRAAPQRFDAAVVSHVASVTAALDFAGALHEIQPDLPVLLATAAAEEIGAGSLLAAGISEVVTRPLASAEVAAALARSLAAPRGSAPRGTTVVTRFSDAEITS